MKLRILPLTILLTGVSIAASATVFTIKNVGNAFTPSSIVIAQGDTVVFDITNDHDAVEVSEATYNANGNAPLLGGFSTPFGGGTVVPTLGNHWYVCTPHASMGMKGIIKVATPSSIQDVFVTATISIYPNPATDLLSVKSSAYFKDMAYSVVDISGKSVYTGSFSGTSLDVDISTLNNGTYYLQLGNDHVKRVHRFLKQE